MRMLMASSFLADLSFEVRDLRIGGVEHLLSLKHIQLRGDAVVHSERSELDGILLGLHGVSRVIWSCRSSCKSVK